MIYKITLINLLLLTSIGLWYKYYPHEEQYHPKFHSKECFLFRHSTAHHPDGYISYTDSQYYTVMWYKEAYKRYAGPKTGYKVPIKWLDEYAVHIHCPW